MVMIMLVVVVMVMVMTVMVVMVMVQTLNTPWPWFDNGFPPRTERFPQRGGCRLSRQLPSNEKCIFGAILQKLPVFHSKIFLPHIGGRRGKFAVHHLRTHVLKGPAHGHLDLPILRIFQVLRQPKVDDPEVVVVVGVGEHDVEGLEVEVEDPLAVDELDASHDLADEDLAFPLGQTVVVGGRPGFSKSVQ